MGVGVKVHECPSSAREGFGEHVNTDWREQTKERKQENQNEDVHERHDFQPLWNENTQ